jgi:hypothetical protein
MPHAWGTTEVVDKEEKVYYRTAYAFTNRLRVAAQSRDPKKSHKTSIHASEAKLYNNGGTTNWTKLHAMDLFLLLQSTTGSTTGAQHWRKDSA